MVPNWGYAISEAGPSERSTPAQVDARGKDFGHQANPLAAGATAIYYPGEIEAQKKARRLVEGIPNPDGVRREFEETAADLGISFT